jgi:hypothetical protein
MRGSSEVDSKMVPAGGQSGGRTVIHRRTRYSNPHWIKGKIAYLTEYNQCELKLRETCCLRGSVELDRHDL